MSNYNERGRYSGSPRGFLPRNQFQSTPKMHRFQSSPYPRSPVYNNQPNMHVSRHSSPYRQAYRDSSNSFNSTASNPDQWNFNSNQSYSSNSSSSYFGDVSQQSPYNSPNRVGGSPFYPQNKNKRFQRNRSFQSPDSKNSNPGHSNDIRQYVHRCMLEDPWKDLMAEIEKNNNT